LSSSAWQTDREPIREQISHSAAEGSMLGCPVHSGNLHEQRRFVTAPVSALTLLLVLWPLAAQAQWSVTPEAGFTVTRWRHVDPEDAMPAIGVALGRNLTPSLTAEAELFYAPDLLPDPPGHSQKLSAFSLSGNAVHSFTSWRVRPYVAIGAGLGRTHFTQPDANPPFRFQNPAYLGLSISVGGGVKGRLSDRLELRGDVRWMGITVPDALEHFWRITTGLTVHMNR
jgi:hypothetical protein